MLIKLLKQFNIDFCAVSDGNCTKVVLMLPYQPFLDYPENCARIDAFYIASNTLYKLTKDIKKRLSEAGFELVDCDFNLKQVAEQGGLGTRLNNQLLANRLYGTKITLQGIVVKGNYPYQADGKIEKACDECGLCDNACPVSALCKGAFIRENCIRHKQDFAEDYYAEVSGRVLGCEECQKICPENAKVQAVNIPKEVAQVFCYNNIFKMLSLGKKGLQPLAELIGSNYARVSYIFNLVVNSLISSGNFDYSKEIMSFKNHSSDKVRQKVHCYIESENAYRQNNAK